MKKDFKSWCKKAWNKLSVAWKEIGNFFTDLCCPLISILIGICAFFQMPASVISALKRAEEWCYHACGTKEKIDNMVNKIDDAIEKIEDKEE